MKSFINFLPPWVETNIQPAFYDKESGTVLQQTARMYAKVNQLVRHFNCLAKETKETVDEYIAKFVELKDFVDTYFENLDVQEEINNKLDAMAEAGTLQEIIGAYLEAGAVWGFDNYADMVASPNLIDGSYAQTLGYYSVGDGGEGLYQKSSGNFVLVPVNEVVTVKQFGAKGDDTTDDTTAIQNAIDYAQTNKVKLILNEGTYLVSKIQITNTLVFEGYKNKSSIKSIDNNTETSIVEILNEGLERTTFKDITIRGDKENQTSEIDGLLLHVNSEGRSADYHTLIENVNIFDASGNGLRTKGDLTGSDIREIRLNNLNIRGCDTNGVYCQSLTDSNLFEVTVSSSTQYGFYMDATQNRMISCKAFWNGLNEGSTEPEDSTRVPASAFYVTADENPELGKKYYTRSGNDVFNDPYIFTLFTGNAFSVDVTYYEMNPIYTKKYAGFYINGVRNNLIGCEAQDNGGDGFYIKGGMNELSACHADNNGLLTSSGTPVSYSSQSKTQLYYGFVTQNWNITISGVVMNFRRSAIGASQKSPLYIIGAGKIYGRISSDDQVSNNIYASSTSLNLVDVTINNTPFVYNGSDLDFNFETGLGKGGIWSIKKKGKTVIADIIINTTDSSALLSGGSERLLGFLPDGFRPTSELRVAGNYTNNNGYNLNEAVSFRVSTNGAVNARSGYTSSAKGAMVHLVFDN